MAVGPFTLTFNSTSPQSFDIPLINDLVVENTENLNAMLSFPGGIAPPRVSIAEETAQITILDDDCKCKCSDCKSYYNYVGLIIKFINVMNI